MTTFSINGRSSIVRKKCSTPRTSENAAFAGMQAAVTKTTFINKEAVREEEQRRETDEKLSQLSQENAETFKQVYESLISRPEFKEHPHMKEIFRAKLADVFVDAERRGIVLKPEERAIDSNLSKPDGKDMER